jgi:hypothetical protein
LLLTVAYQALLIELFDQRSAAKATETTPYSEMAKGSDEQNANFAHSDPTT